MMALRKSSDAAVSISAKESTMLTRLRAAALLRSSCHSTSSVRMLAGKFPPASRVTAGQGMPRAQPCTTAAASLGRAKSLIRSGFAVRAARVRAAFRKWFALSTYACCRESSRMAEFDAFESRRVSGTNTGLA